MFKEDLIVALDSFSAVLGIWYCILMICICAWLWYSRRWRYQTGWILLVISVGILGFVTFAPVMPYQIEQLVLGNEGPFLGLMSLVIWCIIVLLFGRFLCGYFCPVGAAQELAYRVRGKALPLKVHPHQKMIFMLVRAAFVITFVLIAVATSFSLLSFFGIRDFFYLLPTVGTAVFVLIILISTQIYRPFCRLVCPAGFFFSLCSWKSLLKLGRTNDCIKCGTCEKICPTDEAHTGDNKAECYLCGRCVKSCPKGAIRYRRAQKIDENTTESAPRNRR